ncbi:MAG: Holliday junction resolvase RuvX [Actinomycetes bacterium]
MRTGRRLGVDVGTVRIGVAVSDRDGLLAVPLETVARGAGDVARLVALVDGNDAVEVVVGLPVLLSGAEGRSADWVRVFAGELAAALHVPVRLVDERLSTAGAHRALQDAGLDSRRRRAVVDESAAVMILQTALDTERSTGSPAGVEVAGAPATAAPVTARPSQGGA